MEPRIFTKITESQRQTEERVLAAVQSQLERRSADALPCGAIMPYSGIFGGEDGKRPVNQRTGKVHVDYVLCDGNTYTAEDGRQVTTPDLRDRFVLCAGPVYGVGGKGGGGAYNHSHSATLGQTTLAASQMPVHAHNTRDMNTNYSSGGKYGGQIPYNTSVSSITAPYQNTFNTGGGGAHGHGITIHAASTAAELPPYYTLAYIMKI